MWEGSPDGLQLAMRLSQLRSMVRVGLALAEAYPDEESWDAHMANPETQEILGAFATIVNDIQTDLDTVQEPDQVMTAVLNHHERSLEALETFCEPLQLNPNDLIVVLTA